jgi:uroporphyrin-III C-methyltransferase
MVAAEQRRDLEAVQGRTRSRREQSRAMTSLHETLHLSRAPAKAQPATVTLVGAGPGDPDLLTVKAARAIASAPLVLYDRLVSPEIIALLPPAADRIDVGKESARHTLPQDAIIELMVRLARSGRAVLRLKGGDPYIFGRGGEEVEALARAGIPFEVVPGITAAQGAAAACGIPLTHRDHASRVVWVTGHHRGDVDETRALDWNVLAQPGQTLVVYMGLAALPAISARLIEHGLDPRTPAAIVERATTTAQRTVTGTVQTLPALARAADVRSPALILVGAVVGMRDVLDARLAAAGRDPVLRRLVAA